MTDDTETAAAPATEPATPKPAAPAKPAPSKRERVLQLLRRKTGASLAQLQAATGWQAHSVRAALSGLRKDGHAVTREAARKAGGGAVYRVAANAAPAAAPGGDAG